MRTISVTYYPITPTFSSPEAAVVHAKSYGPLAKATADARLLFGSQLIDAFWTDTEFVIRFSNGRFLHIFVEPKENKRNVQWRILESKPELPDAELEQVGSPTVTLQSSEGSQYVMDRSAMIASRRGQDFKQFFVNELGFYVYTRRQRILCFDNCVRVDTGDNLLYILGFPTNGGRGV